MASSIFSVELIAADGENLEFVGQKQLPRSTSRKGYIYLYHFLEYKQLLPSYLFSSTLDRTPTYYPSIFWQADVHRLRYASTALPLSPKLHTLECRKWQMRCAIGCLQ